MTAEAKNTIKKYIYFKHKNIIDFGCNTGGLLLQLGKDINLGIGLDYDPRCINCANAMNNYYKYNLSFYICDFDKSNLNITFKHIFSCHRIQDKYFLGLFFLDIHNLDLYAY